jgi:hypothetical protein
MEIEMNRPVRAARRPILALAGSRSIPPLPHPSWLDGERREGSTGQAIAPEEFWKRLGL